jgi:hypothetical protein
MSDIMLEPRPEMRMPTRFFFVVIAEPLAWPRAHA